MTKYKVTQNRKSEYSKPLQLKKGDLVIIKKLSTKEDGWENWIYCTHNDISGWVPKQIVKFKDNEKGIINEDYSAFELDINIGDILISEKEMNGWIWCFKENEIKTKGWVPLENIVLFNN
jgi:hypothetical protein